MINRRAYLLVFLGAAFSLPVSANHWTKYESACLSGRHEACQAAYQAASEACQQRKAGACQYAEQVSQFMAQGNGSRSQQSSPQGDGNQIQQAERACESGSAQACRDLIAYADPYCRQQGDERACAYIRQVAGLLQRNEIRGGYPQGLYDSTGIDNVPATRELFGAINGRGPGGAEYTNDAARRILEGSMSPADAARDAMGMGR